MLKNLMMLMLIAACGSVQPALAAPGIGGETSAGLLQDVQWRGRGRPRCFVETRRVRFIDRFGRPRVRVVQRRVCR